MKAIYRLYDKYRNVFENGLFIVLLVFYPLVMMNQGLDVTDTTYSLGNFQYFPTADGMWMVATFLANVVGCLFTRLPQGGTMIGMYFYTSLVISLFALLVYFLLRRKIPAGLVFIGEVIAISFCWAPTTVLYHMLTYLLMGLGLLLLWRGCCLAEAEGGIQSNRKKLAYLVGAGLCLGANVTVRMPNIVQAAFILGLWYAAFRQRDRFIHVVRNTCACLVGYIVGFGIPFAAICIKYGVSAYGEMIQDLFLMTDKATDYKPLAMLSGMFADYGRGLWWLFFAALCVGGFYLLYGCRILGRKISPKLGRILWGKPAEWIYRLVCLAVCAVLLRFYWGRGMFSFRYYEYSSMFQCGLLIIMAAVVCAFWKLFSRKAELPMQILSLLILLQVFLTPLGSNNGLYPLVNSMFIVCPYLLWVGYDAWQATRKQPVHAPWKIMAVVLGLLVLVQGMAFHMTFVYRDGINGEERDYLLSDYEKTNGIYTNQENGETFLELAAYITDENLSGKEVLLYGDVPGLSYLLDMPTAISTSWTDLDSYRMERFRQDMMQLIGKMELGQQSAPVVIVSSAVGAYLDDDAEAARLLGADLSAYADDEKLQLLQQFMADYGYVETFYNARYVVYTVS